MIKYILIFTHRSGSSMLTEMLNSCGLGPIREFHENSNIEDYEDCIGVKAAWDSLQTLERQMDTSKCKLIYLRRNDRLRQAVSLHKARDSQQWSSFDEAQKVPEYDYEKMYICHETIKYHENNFENYFKGKPHFSIWYENIDDKMVEDIASYLNIPTTSKPKHEFKMQRNEETEVWCEQFKKDLLLHNRI